MQPESIDLRIVGRTLGRVFSHHPPLGYLRGKTEMRDALEDQLGCSALEAEELVDTMESRGFVRFEGDPAAPTETDTPWAIEWKRDE